MPPLTLSPAASPSASPRSSTSSEQQQLIQLQLAAGVSRAEEEEEGDEEEDDDEDDEEEDDNEEDTSDEVKSNDEKNTDNKNNDYNLHLGDTETCLDIATVRRSCMLFCLRHCQM